MASVTTHQPQSHDGAEADIRGGAQFPELDIVKACRKRKHEFRGSCTNSQRNYLLSLLTKFSISLCCAELLQQVDSTVKHKQNFDRFLISQKPLSNVNTSAKKRDHYYSLAEDFLEITPRKTIEELKECKEDSDYAMYGTIMGVIGGPDWFVAQYRCGTEVVLKLGSYYCEKSSKHVDLCSLKL
ncbi:hypothetical protein Ahy_A01g001948 [Arachis hypogaea]|uniref:Uncharacterized protein n=1 Tax=Arachis hypogaea TaxID=3818 RepID=A0A445EPR1_ARAHY|nr:hypothetical protein Ahy_A01g001948 [Arachis hypogaea]